MAVIWEWNGTDTSQFEASRVTMDGATDSVLSVVADADSPSGNSLQFVIPASTPVTGTHAHAAQLVLENELSLPLRYRVEIWCNQIGTISGRGFGVVLYGDPAHASGFHGFMANERQPRSLLVTAGVGLDLFDDGLGAVNHSGQNTPVSIYKINRTTPTGQLPVVSVMHHGAGTSGQTMAGYTSATIAFDSGAAIPASWQTANLNRFGIMTQSTGSSSTTDGVQFRSIKVYSL